MLSGHYARLLAAKHFRQRKAAWKSAARIATTADSDPPQVQRRIDQWRNGLRLHGHEERAAVASGDNAAAAAKSCLMRGVQQLIQPGCANDSKIQAASIDYATTSPNLRVRQRRHDRSWKILHYFEDRPDRYPWAGEALRTKYKGKRTSRLADMSDDELELCTRDFVQGNACDVGRRTGLETEAALRYKAAAAAATTRGIKGSEYYLRLAHLWMQQHTRESGSRRWSNVFLETFTRNELTEAKLSGLTAGKFVYLSYLAGSLRSMPGTYLPAGNRYAHRALRPYLRDKIGEVIRGATNTTLPEFTFLLEALYKSDVYLVREDDASVTEAVLLRLCRMAPEEVFPHRSAIIAATKLLKTRGIIQSRDTQTLVDKFAGHLYLMDAHTKIRLLNLVTVNCPTKTRHFTREFCNSFAGADLSEMRPKDHAMMLYGLFHLRCDDVAFLERIRDALGVGPYPHPQASRWLLFSVSLLASMQIFHEGHIERIFRAAERSDKLRRAETKEELLEAMDHVHGELCETKRPRPGSPSASSNSPHWLHLQLGLGEIAQVDFLVELFRPDDATMPRLDSALRNKLIQMRPVDSRDGQHEDIIREIQDRLSFALGSDILLGYTFPFSSFPDLVLCLRGRVLPNGKLVDIETSPFPESYLAMDPSSELVFPPHVPRAKWFAIVLAKRGHVDAAGRELGYLAHKRRVLKRLGYNVVVISSVLFGKMMGARKITHSVLGEIAREWPDERARRRAAATFEVD